MAAQSQSRPKPVRQAIKTAATSCAKDRRRLEQIHSGILYAMMEIGLALNMPTLAIVVTISIMVLLRDTGFAMFFADVEHVLVSEITREDAK